MWCWKLKANMRWWPDFNGIGAVVIAPKGLLCRGVWKNMLVCPCVHPHPMSRNRSADLFLASFWNVSRAMLNPRVQKLDHFVLGRPGERKSAGFELWRTYVAPGPSSTGLLYTIVPSGPPLPCGCYLVLQHLLKI